MIETRITELFGVEYPIIQGGMIWVSGAKLAAAVSEAGGLGLIGAGSMRPDLLRAQIKKAKSLTDKPFGVNIPLLYKYAVDMIDIVIEEGVKIVFTSAGSPKFFTAKLKEKGIRVAHVCSTPALAKKCEGYGVDAVVCEGFEAGGHNGREEISTMVLIPQCVDAVEVPVIAAGGIADGRGILAAMALGADGVQVGSRFVATEEASCHESFKNAVINASPGDTMLVMKQLVPVRLLKNQFCQRVLQAEAEGADSAVLAELLGQGRARKGMMEGDMNEGELEIGQVSGTIKQILSAKRIVSDMVKEYGLALEKLK